MGETIDVFGALLELAPFTSEELIAALALRRPTVLLAELHTSVIHPNSSILMIHSHCRANPFLRIVTLPPFAMLSHAANSVTRP